MPAASAVSAPGLVPVVGMVSRYGLPVAAAARSLATAKKGNEMTSADTAIQTDATEGAFASLLT